MNFIEQIRHNRVALISLVVAVAALGYNTWRNELTETNRTVRQAGFEMLIHVGELQRISYLNHYDNNEIEGNPRKGWAEVLLLKDLAALMPANVATATDSLAATWGENWNQLGEDESSIAAMDHEFESVRVALLAELRMLD